jgi:ABC-type sulfate transport system substrate-binding protein
MGVQVNRADILDTAKDFITKDRAATHGDAERNFGLIAAYWSAHLNKNIKPHDVAVMMTLMKLARAKSNPKHIDNWIDGCGYLALGGEAAGEEV